MLARLAVAGRPLDEDLLGAVTGLDVETVRRGLRELAAARLLAEDTTPGGGHRPRHALLAEAVAAGLLPGERAVLHERTARALAAAGGRGAGRGGGRALAGRGPPRRGTARPGWRPPRPPSGCSATPRPRRTGSGPSSCARPCPMPPARPGSTCRSCMCGPSTRWIELRRQRARWAGRRGGLPPVRRSPRPRHRRGRLPPRRAVPGDRLRQLPGCR